MNIKIKNPNNLPVIDYRDVEDLQGDLKEPRAHDKLLAVLKKRGFDIPLLLWFDNEGAAWPLDGHQRIAVMSANDLNDGGSYEVPYIRVEAKTKKAAMARLLEITGQYGNITSEGLANYLALAELPATVALETVDLDVLSQMTADGLDDEFDLGDDEKSPFGQMTFTLSLEQRDLIKAALEMARPLDGETHGNTNSNGNALYWIVSAWVAQNS